MSRPFRLSAPFGERPPRRRVDDRLVVRGTVVESGPQMRARQQLRTAERLSRVVVDGLEEGVVVLDAGLRPMSWNASALRILGLDADGEAPWRGYRPDGIRGTDGNVLSPEALPMQRAAASGVAVADTLRLPGAGGERWVRVYAQPLGGTAGGVVCTLDDVTEAVHAETRLREERDRAEGYLEVASTLVVVLDFHGRIERVNRQGCAMLGFAESELIGRDWFDTVIPASERLQARQAFVRLVSEVDPPRETVETFVETKDGDDRKIAWRNAVVRDDDGRVVAVLRSGEDVTERRRAEAQVNYLAFHDALTGLANRARLERELAREVARATRGHSGLALLYFDLDNFKLVNDSLGHAAGDAVLCEAAQRVTSLVRGGDLLARQGGDEFLLMLTCDPREDAREVAQHAAERVLSVFDSPLDLNGTQFHVGTSVGVAVYGEHAVDAEELLKCADSAMYDAKRAGGGEVAFYQRPTGDALRRLSLSSRLRRAIQEDQLTLHYQPIFATGAHDVPVGYEALARWHDPDEGPIGPDTFIPVAEESGLIEALGRWVIEAVCAQAATWAAAGLRPQLGFNLSPRELRRPDLAASIVATIAAHGLEPAQFCAELTESALMSDERRHTSLLGELTAAGLTVAIDDFGSGMSSLGRLRDLPVQVLKVDRAFLRRVPQDPESAAIVRAVLDLASALGMASVVEGVETEEQLEFLEAAGATRLQGYLLGRPAPPIVAEAVAAP